MKNMQVLIIGGGAMGVSLLYHLTKMGRKDVLLIEKNDLTHGSTWHAAGLCTHFAHIPTIQELRARSVRLYRDILPAETGRDCGFHPTGAMRITKCANRMKEFHHVAGLSAFTGYPLKILSAGEIEEQFPLAKTGGLLGGIYEPDDGHVDPSLATHAMAEMARQNGGEIWRHCALSSLCRTSDGWIAETEKEPVRAQLIVNAAGTWGHEIGKMMGVNVPSVPVLHQYLVTDRIETVADRQATGLAELPIIRDPDESWYVRQERDGLILGPYEKDAEVWSVDGVPPEFGADLLPPDLDRVEGIISKCMARIPVLETCGIKTVINGPITFSPDANPLIGPAHGVPDAWLLTGSSMGVMEGGGAGWFLARWIVDGSPPMDATAIDPRRFGKWADRTYRVEKAVECFARQFAVHYPFENRPAARNKRLSPLHDLMLKRGAVMGSVHGWERPDWFSDQSEEIDLDTFDRTGWFSNVAREIQTATKTVALADLSVFSKFEVSGPETAKFLDWLGANRPPKPGRVGLCHVLTETGGIQSEFTMARLDPEMAYLTSAAAAEERDLDLLNEQSRPFDVQISNVTENYAVIGLMGPKAPDVWQELTGENPATFPWLSVREFKVDECAIRALRLSYIGEPGFELHVPAHQAEALFLRLERAATPHGMGFYGAFAANSMRLEKGYPSWGADLGAERSPTEAGLQAFVKCEGREFLGRKGLLDWPHDWEMVLLAIEGSNPDPFFGHTIWQKDKPVGLVTSAAYGHRTCQNLALAWLRDKSARRNLEVAVLDQRYTARVLDEPPFDPANNRLKASYKGN